MNEKDLAPKILGLDVSTKTIGVALFENGDKLKLLELSHVSPRPKPKTDNKIEELLKKASIMEDYLTNFQGLNVQTVIIEEPLISSNNAWTIATLLRFNTLVAKAVYDKLGVVAEFISTSDSRRYGFPQLVCKNENSNRNTLFGCYPKDVDKKKVIWEEVSKLYPEIKWPYNRNNVIAVEAFDESDSICCVLGYLNKKKQLL